MKEKKEYQKPQVSQVKLVVQNPILGLCNSIAPQIAQFPLTCNFGGANCSGLTPGLG